MIKVLSFLRLVDENKQISLTNIGVMIVLTKLALVQQAGVADLGALLLALVSYNCKKLLTQASNTDTLRKISSAVEIITKGDA